MLNLRDNVDSRIDQARANLGGGTLIALLGQLFQSTRQAYAPLDNRFLDQKARAIPQSIVDQQNYQIDRSLMGSTEGILRNAPLNRAANTLGALEGNAVNAKSALGLQVGLRNVDLNNRYLDQKDASLQRYNAGVTQADNAMIDNRNTQIGNIAGIGTNYFNELQKSINRVNAFKDQKALTTESMNSLLPMLRGFMGNR